MSWLFLGSERVYKLKKPVRYAFLDFSTVAKRRFFCFEELRLNRRLAAGTYLSVIPLCRGAEGDLRVHGDGEAVDWVVEMRRLPDCDMLHNRMQAGSVGREDIEALATLLARFYERLPSERLDFGHHLAHLSEQMEVNASVLCRQSFELAAQASPILARARQELKACVPELSRRLWQGWFREGHGDLRPEHVCLVRPIQIIDCLEFNRMMRIVDPFEEVAQLSLECNIAGLHGISDDLISNLAARLGGRPTDRLFHYYIASKALLRARLCMAHLLDRNPRDPSKWRPLAVRYLNAAEQELRALSSL